MKIKIDTLQNHKMHVRVFLSKIHFKVDNIVVNIFFTKKTTHSRLCITVKIFIQCFNIIHVYKSIVATLYITF